MEEKDDIIDLGVGFIGNVDSSKSTTIGALVTGQLDDGNGKLRAKVSRHPHEIKSGRTSDIAYRHATFGNKRITFVDLAGHEKYLKTTITGLGSFLPDLLCLCVDRYAHTYKMTKEHLGLALRMNIPFIVMMTKVDLYEKEITDASLALLSQVIKRSSSRKMFTVKNEKDVLLMSKMYTGMSIVPVFRISNVTGEGLNFVKQFFSMLTKNNKSRFKHPLRFISDRDYRIKGIGLVVTGFNGGPSIAVGDELYINNKTKAVVRSIHNDFRESIQVLPHNSRGCLAIRTSEHRVKIGSVLSKEQVHLTSIFKAKVKILNSHSTTIKKGFRSVIHCGALRITGEIADDIVIRSGDKCSVTFTLQYPVYLEVEQSIFFREGRVIGEGVITNVN